MSETLVDKIRSQVALLNDIGLSITALQEEIDNNHDNLESRISELEGAEYVTNVTTGGLYITPAVIRLRVVKNTGDAVTLELPTVTASRAGVMSAALYNSTVDAVETVEGLQEAVSSQSDAIYNLQQEDATLHEEIDREVSDLREETSNLCKAIAKLHNIECDQSLIDTYALTILLGWDATITSMKLMYYLDAKLKYFPNVDTSKVTDFEGAFWGSGLKAFPAIDMSAATNIASAFDSCAIEEVPDIALGKVTNAVNTFSNCTSLKKTGNISLPECTDHGWNFLGGCTALEEVGDIYLPKVASGNGIFQGDTSLKKIGKISIGTGRDSWDAFKMFYSCSSLTDLPEVEGWDKCTGMSQTFRYSGIKSIVFEDGETAKVTDMDGAFENCPELTSVDGLDFTACTGYNYMIKNCPNLVFFKGKNFGKAQNVPSHGFNDTSTGTTKWGYGSDANRQSLVDTLLTDSYDRASAGYSAMRVQLNSAVAGRLTSAEKAAITAKGFTLVS